MLGMLIPGAPLPLVVLPLANIFSSFQDFRFGSLRSEGFCVALMRLLPGEGAKRRSSMTMDSRADARRR